MQRHLFILLFVVLGLLSCQTPQKPAFESSSQHPLDSSIINNPEIEAKIAPLRDSVEAIMNEVIGESKSDLFPDKPETPLSNFVADLLLDAAKKEIEATGKKPLPIITVINVRGLRTAIPEGKITVEDIFSLMPFENQLVLLKLSGLNVRKLFQHMGESGGDGLAGASFTFSEGEVKNAKTGGQAIENEEFYYVATSDYLASGGDHYTIFQQAVEEYEFPSKIRDLIISHIRALSKKGELIDPATNKRIKFN
ncbi:5'-nucleotidase C-terminal domain-containing protein [Marinilabilia rubra]|uniref:5'-Nucleotidase C-terminal domain-containing protein n=1 Tax=Marinilabilia rubra TaxID=2162893 RepID=A0A2U2B4X0_9BACT|nr:5'-nucleotidase [Marinilabilia rubra]PWD98118.1 hypothetical protein DDZ16_17405 [Marinilabilia rubra]